MLQTKSRVAVVGYGYWGAKHVRVLSSLPDVSVTVVDSNADRLAEASSHYPAARLDTSLDGVLDEVDAVVVATPPAGHSLPALAALEAGVPTLVEKPLAASVSEAELLVETAARRRTTLMVGHTFEYNPAVRALRQIVRSGVLGRILYIDTARLSLGRYQADVNVIWDLAPHDISIVSYLLDEVPTASSVWADRHVGLRHADVAHLRLDFPESGTRAFVHVSWLNPDKVRRVTVVGERKMVVYDDMSDNERIRIYDIGVDPSEIDEGAAAHAMPVTYRSGGITSPFIPFDEPLQVQDQHFVDCVRSGADPDTPGQRGLDIVRVLSATDTMLMPGGVAVPVIPSSGRAVGTRYTDRRAAVAS